MKSLRTIVCALSVLCGCFDPENVRDPSLDPPKDASADATTDGSQQDGRHDGGNPQACTASEQCADLAAPRCENRECGDCAEEADCERFAGARACGPEGTCVQCTEQHWSDCEANYVCLAGGNVCVECNVDSDCNDAANAKCDTGTHTCVPCDDNAQCERRGEGLSICGPTGSCVACTPETEVTVCGNYACDPDTFQCTSTPRNSLGTCRACRSDSECGADRRCIRVPFMGDEGNFYCMQVAPETTDCPLPYQGPIINSVSKNGAPSARYCAHNTNVTTCDAIASLTSNKNCTLETVEADCGPGARCEPRPIVLKCTYSCSSDAVCPADFACNEEGATSNPYCGGP